MVYPIMKTLVHTGYEIEKFSRYASFDSSLLQDVEARIAEEELERLMDAAVKLYARRSFRPASGSDYRACRLGRSWLCDAPF